MGLVEKVPWLIVRLFLTFTFIERCRALPLSGYGTQGRSVVRRQQIERPPSPSSSLQLQDLHEDRKQYTQAKSITVRCHQAWMEIVVKADLYDTGVLIDGADLRLGSETLDACRARPSGPAEYTIFAALSDCGNKHLITDDSLIYTNVLVYSPMPSSNGIVRMEGVVIPIECHYGRRYGVSSGVLKPTWIPFASTVLAENVLGFGLRLMTSDWHSERASNVYFLGDTIHIQASVTLDYHMPLRLFAESCVATVDPDKSSVPRYAFVGNDGCLTDARATGSSSHFLPRARDDTLQIQLDAFRFRQETRSALYITCHLKAIPVIYNVDSRNRACSSILGRWRSADGNDGICDSCETANTSDQRTQSGRPSNPTTGGYYGDHGEPVKDGRSFTNQPGSGTGLEKEVSLRPFEVHASVPGNAFPRSRPLDNGSVEDKASRMSETDAGKEIEKEKTRGRLGDPSAKEDASAFFDDPEEGSGIVEYAGKKEFENETTVVGPVIHPSKDYADPVLLASEEPSGSVVLPSKDEFSPAVPTSREDATPAVPPGQQTAETISSFLDPRMEQEGPPMIPTSGGDNPVDYPEFEMEATPGSVVPPGEQESSPMVLRDEKDEIEKEKTRGRLGDPSAKEDASAVFDDDPEEGSGIEGYADKKDAHVYMATVDASQLDNELESETTLGPVIHPRMDYVDPAVLAGEYPVGSAASPGKGAGTPVAPSEGETYIAVPPGKDELQAERMPASTTVRLTEEDSWTAATVLPTD